MTNGRAPYSEVMSRGKAVLRRPGLSVSFLSARTWAKRVLIEKKCDHKLPAWFVSCAFSALRLKAL